MLIIHIVIALLGVAASTGLFVRPTRRLYSATSGLLIGTLLSGTVLVLAHPAHMVRACIVGLMYTGFVALSLYIAGRRIAANQRV